MQKNKVLILGAGLLGLRIADLLIQKGYRVEIAEADSVPGGMVGTFKRSFGGEDYYFDYGPHLFFRDYKDVYQELIGDDLLYIVSNFSMIIKGKRLAYPLRIKEVLASLSPMDIILTGTEVACNQLFRRKGNPNSLEEWMTRRFGTIPFEHFYAPYIGKCNGLPPAQVAIDWATERTHVIGNSLMETVWKRLKTAISHKEDAPNLPSSDEITAYYPRKGAGQLTDALAARVAERGGIIHLNTRVNKVLAADRSIEGIIANRQGREIRLKADHYVSTIPLPLLIKGITPEVFPAYIEAADYLKYRQLILMYLIINQPRVLDHIEVFFADEGVIFKRIYEPKSLSGHMGPAGKTSLCLEICCSETDNVPEEELYKKAVGNLEQAGIITPDKISGYFTVRLPYAYPIYRQGFKDKVDLLLEFVNGMDNLVTSGRQGIFKYHAMTNETMEMATRIADRFQKL